MGLTTFNLVGQHLANGRYAVLSRLDEGGMAFVYLALDRSLQTNVVIKVPRLSLTHEDDFGPRFEREIGSLVKLLHPHICRILDVGRYDEVPFVVLPYLGGGNLNDHRASATDGTPQATPASSLHRWLSQTAAALDYIHSQSYAHRDVKPGNIIFDEHGCPYLSDFGVAKILGDDASQTRPKTLTQTGMTLGTPQYMAPELIMGQPFDGRIDQYALAVTVFEIVSGRFPFDGNSPGAIIVAATTQKCPSLADMDLGISREVSQAVRKGLARKAEDRFQTCEAFAQAVLSGIPERPKTAFVPAKRRGSPAASSKMLSAAGTQPSKTHVCPQCGTHFRLKATSSARKAKCPGCRGIVDVGPSDPSPSTTSSAVLPVPTGLHETESLFSATTVKALDKRGTEKKPAPGRPKLSPAVVISAVVAAAVVVGTLVVAFQMTGHRATPVATVPSTETAPSAETAKPSPKSLPIAAASKPVAPPEPLVTHVAPPKEAPPPVIREPVQVQPPRGSETVVKTNPVPELRLKRATDELPLNTPASPEPKRRPEPPARTTTVEVPKTSARDTDLAVLETRASKCATAKDAVALYGDFASKHTMTASQQDKFKTNLQNWETKAGQNLVRFGDRKWVSEADATRAHSEAAEIYRQGVRVIDVRNFKQAKSTLEKASRADPNFIEADFTLGLLYALVPEMSDSRKPDQRFKDAHRYFLRVVSRRPDYVPALNNLALSLIRERLYDAALERFRAAARSSPVAAEVTHNIARFIGEAKRRAFTTLKKGEFSNFTKLFGEVGAAGAVSQDGSGWQYMPLVSTESDGSSGLFAERKIYDDHVCSRCNGGGEVPCDAGCQHGKFFGEKVSDNVGNFGMRNQVPIGYGASDQTVRICPTCRGTGRIRCPLCGGNRREPDLP